MSVRGNCEWTTRFAQSRTHLSIKEHRQLPTAPLVGMRPAGLQRTTREAVVCSRADQERFEPQKNTRTLTASGLSYVEPSPGQT